MKRLVSTVLIVLTACVAFAQEPTKKKQGNVPAEQAAIAQLEKEWADALVKADYATLDRLMSSDWLLTDTEGTLQTKEQAIADMKSGKVKFVSLKLDDLKVRVYGNTAVAFGLSTDTLVVAGKTNTAQVRYTDTFLKRDGKWVCVATHVTTVAKK